MTEPFTPDEGATVEYYNEEAELWETGTVAWHSANRRLYCIQPDEETEPMRAVNYTSVRPCTPVEHPLSFWEAAKTFARAHQSANELAQSYWETVKHLEDVVDRLNEDLLAEQKRAARAEHLLQIAEREKNATLRAHDRVVESLRARDTELTELKKALATLAGAEAEGRKLP